MNRPPFETGKIYHVYNRGTEKRHIFMDNSDRSRFLLNMFEFNDEHPALNWQYKDLSEVRPQKKVVEILSYCLMPNHYHLMIRQIQDGGITLFMRKLGTGYTGYFNKKYDRNGTLFQGKFKSKLINQDSYVRHLPHYIHLNPAKLRGINWRSYHWSSYSAFLDPTKRSSLIDLDFIHTLYEPSGYEASLNEWVRDKENLNQLSEVLLD